MKLLSSLRDLRLTLILGLALWLGLQKTRGQFSYTAENGAITINGYISDSAAVIIPEVIDGLPVKAIKANAFSRNAVITSVKIADSVEFVGEYAFNGAPLLTTVDIGRGVSTIGDYAFLNCPKLQSINVALDNSNFVSKSGVLLDKNQTFLKQFPPAKSGSYVVPNGVLTIGKSAFYKSLRLTSVTIPDSVTVIGESAFSGSTLTSVSLGAGITTIEATAFSSCSLLTTVYLPKSLTNLGDLAFFDCPKLQSLTVDPLNPNFGESDGVLFNKSFSSLIIYPRARPAASFTIPGSVTAVRDYAFFGCLNLRSISMFNEVESVGGFAFAGCRSLTNVSMSLGLKDLGEGAFFSCDSLRSIAIPNGVSIIKSSTFISCSSLAEISLPSKLLSIGESAFFGCSALMTVALPDTVTSIGLRAFFGCSRLSGASLGRSLAIIGDGAFENCGSLNSVYFPGLPPAVGVGVFPNNPSCVLYFGEEFKSLWPATLGGKATKVWDARILIAAAPATPPTDFGFSLSGTAGLRVVIEVSTDLAQNRWLSLQTNVLAGTPTWFSPPPLPPTSRAATYRLRTP